MKDTYNIENAIVGTMDDVDTEAVYAPLTYEVWSIGYDADNKITDSEMFIKEFKDPDEAIAFAKQLTLADIIHMDDCSKAESVTVEVSYISVEVETVINDANCEFVGGTMNIGTIYRKQLWIREEDISLSKNDYTILEDGTLKIKRDLLKQFNKNDSIKILFKEEDSILTYKIISKVVYADAEYYHCEFVF